jgi:hypothetical protein
VVSAFLIDFRANLRDGLVVAFPSDIKTVIIDSVVLECFWYVSLVLTLISAFWAVLAQRWILELLHENPDSPGNRALERWRRDKAAIESSMGRYVAGPSHLLQFGLSTFLVGLGLQSLNEEVFISVVIVILVVIGFFLFATCTLDSLFRHSPFRTPLTSFLQWVFRLKRGFSSIRYSSDEDTNSKVQILASKLNISSHDEIFFSAASFLNAKLESEGSKKWYKSEEDQNSALADALSLRLKSVAYRLQTTMITEGQAFIDSLSSPTAQGIICLRILLQFIEGSTADNIGSSWINRDSINLQWRTSKTFPEAWRLLSWSIDITRRVADSKVADFDENDIMAIDWDNMIRKTSIDPTLLSIAGVSAFRGLLEGKENVKRICALGLAMFLEVEGMSGQHLYLHVDLEAYRDFGT